MFFISGGVIILLNPSFEKCFFYLNPSKFYFTKFGFQPPGSQVLNCLILRGHFLFCDLISHISLSPLSTVPFYIKVSPSQFCGRKTWSFSSLDVQLNYIWLLENLHTACCPPSPPLHTHIHTVNVVIALGIFLYPSMGDPQM